MLSTRPRPRARLGAALAAFAVFLGPTGALSAPRPRAQPSPSTATLSTTTASAPRSARLRLKTVATIPTPSKSPSAAFLQLRTRALPRRTDAKRVYALKCALLAAIASSLIVAATIAVFWVIQDSLVYKPTAVWRGSPAGHGMPFFEDVRYCTVDKVEITGWFIKQPPEVYAKARTLIYFHGTDKNASFRLKKVVGFYRECGCNVLLLSYRGYGVSTGSPNEKGIRIDAESAFDYLQSRGDVDVSDASGSGNLWVFGESLGGAVAVYFASQYERYINALIVENTFTSLLDMIKLEFPILGIFRYLSRNRWQSKKRIGKLTLPILFLSGARDTYIPPDMMRQMHDLAANSKEREFVEFDRGTHNRTWTLEGFYEAVSDFMGRVDGTGTAKRPVDDSLPEGDNSSVGTAAA